MAWKKRGISRRTAVRLVLAAAVLAAVLIYREAGLNPFGKESAGLHDADGGGGAIDRRGPLSVSSQAPASARAPKGQAISGLPIEGVAGASPDVHLAPPSHSQRSAVSRISAASGRPVKTAAAAVRTSARPKTVYLTFDDGPSAVTPKVLEILNRERVKATFFVLGNEAETHPEWINAIREQGSTIGNHTYDHNYKELYSGFTRFWSQIKKTEETIRLITGTRPQLVRAPGGTFGHFDDTYFQLMKQAGYRVTDWTVDSGDSKRRGVPASEITKNSIPDTKASKVILLLHDGAGHEESAKALPEIIKRYKAAGYVFKTHPGKSGSGRIKPAEAWIEANVLPNAALFAPGKKLVVEAGMLQASLQPGEYRIEDGRYIVPLRSVVERFGGRVNWSAGTHSGQAELNGREITADTASGRLTLTGAGPEQEAISSGVVLEGGAIWLPLRDLLEAAGHPLLGVANEPEARTVKAS
ncbi:polysaccharide deacetylase family protein [Paenibacillus sp. 7124]|uniref:Polysaccharide deacetylase family protein n=1 Tax=Paenibacillus apii TaxID=1850370 RepID=A0A6M1PQC5_9BACL|nr:polysaccharide deacetylase [Paenibacillus apii]NGM85530.1 polysaccharide deacetylase family protein [Paenibacillus apii]